MKKISLVVPTYHEEESLPIFFSVVNPILDSLVDRYEFEIIFVTDMPDKGTYNLLIEKQKEQKNIVLVRLSRSFGHEEAVAAGLSIAKGDAVIPLDSDLQDDPAIIPSMIEKWEDGYQVVNGKRASREEKGLSKLFVKTFYKIFHKWSKKINVPMNVGDFRLLDRVVVDSINAFKTNFRVLKIDVPYCGYKTCEVSYVRKNRVGGKTHYSKFNLFKNAFDYFTIISDKLLLVAFKIAFVSVIVSLLSFVTLIVFAIINNCLGNPLFDASVYVWWSILSGIVLTSGLIEFCIFIVGGYANRAFNECSGRPTYIIESIKYSDERKNN